MIVRSLCVGDLAIKGVAICAGRNSESLLPSLPAEIGVALAVDLRPSVKDDKLVEAETGVSGAAIGLLTAMTGVSGMLARLLPVGKSVIETSGIVGPVNSFEMERSRCSRASSS